MKVLLIRFDHLATSDVATHARVSERAPPLAHISRSPHLAAHILFRTRFYQSNRTQSNALTMRPTIALLLCAALALGGATAQVASPPATAADDLHAHTAAFISGVHAEHAALVSGARTEHKALVSGIRSKFLEQYQPTEAAPTASAAATGSLISGVHAHKVAHISAALAEHAALVSGAPSSVTTPSVVPVGCLSVAEVAQKAGNLTTLLTAAQVSVCSDC